ncbi:MAG: nucleotidyltransferase family protein [Candidatus Caenarcaniphilales bacterium]|nr:nucleotidyltransferase family protein [Candidatus Caenarcaniphilales bacterium]
MKQDLPKILQERREEILQLACLHGALNVRVFGSVVRGDNHDGSDIDFLIDLAEQTSPWFPMSFIQDLEQVLHCKVDVVTAQSLKPRLRDSILQEAKPL